MLQNHISEGAYIFERGWVPAASTGFCVGLNLERLMFWILSKQVGEKEDKVWLWRNVCCAKIGIYCPGLKNQKTATKYPNFAEVRIMVIGVFKNKTKPKKKTLTKKSHIIMLPKQS